MSEALNTIRADFDPTQLPGDATAREAALARFEKTGWPTRKQEEWKYTSLHTLSETPLNLPTAGTLTALPAGATIKGLEAYRLVFTDGRFDQNLSQEGELPVGVTLGNLAGHWQDCDQDEGTALAALNQATAGDGLYLEIADGVTLDRPIHLLCIANTANTENTLLPLRHHIRLGRNAAATLIEHYLYSDQYGDDEPIYYRNVVLDIALADGANLNHTRLQNESPQAWHTSLLEADLSRDAVIRLHGIDLGGRLARNDLNIRLNQPGAEAHLDGLYAPAGHQHIDNHTRVDHISPHCISREAYRGILDGRSRGVFNGKVVVHEGAIKTDSEQYSDALLLAEGAEVDAKPELEIYNDDVKCAHGATVGQLDNNALFYLQSRGIDEDTARSMLTWSFADEIIGKVGNDALRQHIEKLFMARLPDSIQLDAILK